MLQPSAEPIRGNEMVVRGSGDPPGAASAPRTKGQAAGARAARQSLVERVREKIASLGCDRVWVRGAGSQVLLGLRGEDAYARLTPARDSLFGLAFRAEPSDAPEEEKETESDAGAHAAGAWHPLLLVDALEDVVEHALIAVDAVPVQA